MYVRMYMCNELTGNESTIRPTDFSAGRAFPSDPTSSGRLSLLRLRNEEIVFTIIGEVLFPSCSPILLTDNVEFRSGLLNDGPQLLVDPPDKP